MHTKLIVTVAIFSGAMAVGCRERSKTPVITRPAVERDSTPTTESEQPLPTIGPVAVPSNAVEASFSNDPSANADVETVRNEMDRFAAKLEEVTDFFDHSENSGSECVVSPMTPPPAMDPLRPAIPIQGTKMINGL